MHFMSHSTHMHQTKQRGTCVCVCVCEIEKIKHADTRGHTLIDIHSVQGSSLAIRLILGAIEFPSYSLPLLLVASPFRKSHTNTNTHTHNTLHQ